MVEGPRAGLVAHVVGAMREHKFEVAGDDGETDLGPVATVRLDYDDPNPIAIDNETWMTRAEAERLILAVRAALDFKP